MAARTVTGDVVVIEIRGRPAGGCMTVIAGFTALDMANVLARCGAAVVAVGAGAEHLQMIDMCHGRE